MQRILLQLVLSVLLATPSFAADWVVDRVRGTAQQLIGGQWIDMVRGGVVLDGHSIRTGPNGRVDLVRGAEVIELSSGTQILLHEGAGNFTSIKQSSGVVTADVERRNVQHFSIQTPYLAAIVKGTRFQVSVGDGAAHVEVDRGTVQVQDTINDLVVDIGRGQEAQVSQTTPLEVSGAGTVAVFTFEGLRVVNGTADVPADERGRAVDPTSSEMGVAPKASGPNNVGNNGNGNGGGNDNGNNGNGNGGGNDSGNNGNGNGGGNGNGNSGNGNGGGNGNGNNGNGNGGGNGNGNSDNGNGGGNDSGNYGNGNGGGNDSGNNGNGNGGGNGNGNGGNNGKGNNG